MSVRKRSGGPGLGRLWTVLAALAAVAPPGHGATTPAGREPGAAGQEQDTERARDLAALGSPDPAVVRAAFERLLQAGEAGDLLIFGDAPARARRARVELAARLGGKMEAVLAGPRVADPDPGVRRALMAFLGRPDLGEVGLQPLVGRARFDPDPDLRLYALELLAGLPDEGALDALERLLVELEGRFAVAAAGRLADTPRARVRVRDRVLEASTARTGGTGRPLSDGVYGTLLAGYGSALAADPDGGGTARERAPLLLGLEHPSAVVRRGALVGVETFLVRVRARGERERALRLLEHLADGGFDPRAVHLERLEILVGEAEDPAPALADARALARPQGPPGSPDERIWSARAVLLEGAVQLALGRDAEAEALCLAARDQYRGLVSLRIDRWSDGLEGDERRSWNMAQAGALEELALAELYWVTARLAQRTPPGDRALLEAGRRAHRALLEAQLAATRGGVEGLGSWDSVIDHQLSMFRLLFPNRRNPRWSSYRALGVQSDLARVLASVAAEETPGPEPIEGLPPEFGDPVLDPERRGLLEEIQLARVVERRRELIEAGEQLRRRALQNGGVADPDDFEAEQRSSIRLRILQRERAQVEEGDDTPLRQQRSPSGCALELAQDLRTEGRNEDARTLLRRMEASLAKSGLAQSTYHGLELLAQIAMTIGSSWTDDDEPRKAEAELTKAVDRLLEIEQELEERYPGSALSRKVRGMRSSALVSLAVNANVRLGRPEVAERYFQEAFELRQDDFMRVLLACYRARAGQADEARRILREVTPSPALYYNLACTYALMGEVGPALDYLARELEENHTGSGSLVRQKAWAREDPDLANLRDDPRFEQLTAP